jgi:glycosyltransferase involved in cell wall biosynthesis
MILLNIITRCTRTTKIKEVFESIDKKNKNFKINWYVLFDLTSMSDISTDVISFLKDKSEIRFYDSDPDDFGHDMINKTIDEIQDGLVYVLDDDNIIHPNFLGIVQDWIENHNQYDGLIFSQKIAGVDFTGLDIREAKSENVVVSKIDMAQFCLKRSLIGEHRIPKNFYVGDGMFIENLYNTNVDKFLIIEEIGCYYNYFKQVEVVDYFLPRVLVVGDETHTQLTSFKFANYEDNRLKINHIENDENIFKILSEFKPDGIISVGSNWNKYTKLSSSNFDIRKRWIHTDKIDDNRHGEEIFNSLNFAMLDPFYEQTPLMSVFTPIYNTGQTLLRTYESMKTQKYGNWEWVLLNDSTDGGKTLKIAQDISREDPRVKVYDFHPKSGGIVGESKYRAASLCSGRYLIELDHDDVLLPDALQFTLQAFIKYPDAKFVYSDCAEIDENHNSLTYGDNFAFGYGSYRDEEYNGRVYKAVNTQNINPKTIRHIVGVPNHLRAWDRFFYHSIGGHNRKLSIADDYELLVRTFLKTKFVRIPKMLYLQFFHNSNTQNTSRADIQRRVRVVASFYNEKIKSRFDELGVNDWAYEGNPIWPTNTPSRFGQEENAVNYIYDFGDENVGYDQSKLRSFSILN